MQPGSVISITEYRNRETIATLEGLLQKAMDGDVQGIIYAVKLEHGPQAVGFAGYYAVNPTPGLTAAARVFELLTTEAKRAAAVRMET